MNPNPEKKTLRDSVLSAIESGKVTMRPRWQYVLKAALLIAGAVLTALTALFLISFAVFSLRKNGAWFAPTFGLRGVRELFLSLPWLIILLAVIFIVLLEVLVRRYQFAYRRPLLYTAVGVLLLAVVGGVVIGDTDFHEGLFEQARLHHPPLWGLLYENCCRPPSGWVTAGVIIQKTTVGFRLQTDDETYDVLVTPQTSFPYGTIFSQGDRVVVVGERNDDTITAQGVRPAGSGLAPRQPRQRFEFQSSPPGR